MRMTAREREHFCGILAALFSPPEKGVIEQIRDRAPLLEEYAASRGGGPALLAGFKTGEGGESLFGELSAEYGRLFSPQEGGSVSLIESSHKPWTGDAECPLPFARQKGLLLGDSALHMADLFRWSGLEVPPDFQGCPDHLVLELEFLSALYARATDSEAGQFIRDHLDWVPELRREMARFHPHPFYLGAVELLALFLEGEKSRMEMQDHGTKSIH